MEAIVAWIQHPGRLVHVGADTSLIRRRLCVRQSVRRRRYFAVATGNDGGERLLASHGSCQALMACSRAGIEWREYCPDGTKEEGPVSATVMAGRSRVRRRGAAAAMVAAALACDALAGVSGVAAQSTLNIQAGVGDGTVAGQAFMPGDVTVLVGSSVTWNIGSDDPHRSPSAPARPMCRRTRGP